MKRWWDWALKALGLKRRYLIFRFNDPFEPLRRGEILAETATFYTVRIPIWVFNVRLLWDTIIPKTHPRIVEVIG